MFSEKISDEVAKKYFETNLKAAKIGIVESMCEVARMYFEGFGTEKNFDKAVEWYEKAVAEGDEFATVTLGKIYSKKNVEKAIFYLSKSAEKNNIKAIQKLAEIYESRNDFEKMFECYEKGAKLGSCDLMREVANCYLAGRGVRQDDLKALEWYIKIVEIYGCDNNDMRMITKIYNKHFKFTDKKILNKYYVTTEKLGHFNAMFGIAAELYKTDKYRALKWYRLADLAGDYDAAMAVDHIITNDLSSVDIYDHYFEAREWYKKAVEFGNINAAKNLMMMYSEGFQRGYGGYLPDVKKSLYWLNKVLESEGKNV